MKEKLSHLNYVEGFGLSLVEGMYYGQPCMMFSDIDAFEDIYNEKVSKPIRDRSKGSVVKCFEELLARNGIEASSNNIAKNQFVHTKWH